MLNPNNPYISHITRALKLLRAFFFSPMKRALGGEIELDLRRLHGYVDIKLCKRKGEDHEYTL
jgi:hypothetical protein